MRDHVSWRRTSEGAPRKPQRPAWPTFKRIVRLLTPHKSLLAGFLVAITFASLVGLAPPLLIRRIIDDSIPNNDGGELNLLIVGMVVVILLASFNGVLQSYLGNSISQSVMFDLRDRLYRHLSSMSLRWFTANRTGETLSRINNDVGSVQNVIMESLGGVLGNLIVLISTFVIMLALDWRLALFSIVFIPIFVIPARRVGNVQRALWSESQEEMATMNSQMQETLSVSGILLMKTFGRQRDEADRFSGVAGRIRSLSVRRAMVGRWFQMGMGLFGTLGPAVVYWYGGHRVIDGEVTLGTIVAMAALLPRLFGPITSLLNVQVTVLSSLALFERIFDYLDLEADIQEKDDASELTAARGDVDLRNVDFSYIPGQPVLRDVSLRVEAGQFAALVGPTGAGKTTIALLVPRLYDVDAGSVRIDGHDVRDLTLNTLSDNVAMVDQEPYLFHTSILENLRYARPEATDDEVEAAARAANIHEFISLLPEGYDTVVGERGYRLSGGEKQRVAIARALLKDPAVLILDEATSSVDSITERAIREALERVTRGRTVLAIAHRLSTVLAADVVFVIDEGRVVEQGTHAELIEANGRYLELYEHQLIGPAPRDVVEA
ncbi:MAG TPA: ABC transporter ATP-binding protein [Dehalococcoidia bacterium]|nr:ABC transporter ATP-binding protein [Dehalococcoidia bacterium]